MLVSNTKNIKCCSNTNILSTEEEFAPSVAKKITNRKHSKDILLHSQLIEELTSKESGWSDLDVTEVFHQLVESKRLIRVQDSGLIQYRLEGTLPRFQERIQRLQEAYLRTDQNPILDVLDEEDKEIESATILQKEEEEDFSTGGRGRKKRKGRKRPIIKGKGRLLTK